MESPTTNIVFMVRPAAFGFNPQTAESNAFQQAETQLSKEAIQQKAIAEFDNMVELLRQTGVTVVVIQDTETPVKTDAVFPNNWITFHANGQLITYPMMAPIRRLERRADVIADMKNRFGFTSHLTLEEYEEQEWMLEGTGSLILDRVHRIAYACLSPRTHPDLLAIWCNHTGYTAEVFTALDEKGQAIYHTNVMMALGADFVVICLEAIADMKEREQIKRRFEATQKRIIPISFEQMNAFAGNMLHLHTSQGAPLLVMSKTAYDSLDAVQINTLQQHTKLLVCPIPTIEYFGGGSARCMMAEVFVPTGLDS